jgi:ABC-type lipoprotein export system ATPase subunit
MIARALSTSPRLLLADEPTGSLDTRRAREVLELLRSLARERAVATVIVSHDPLAAAYADRVLALRDGQLCDYRPGALPADSTGWAQRAAAPASDFAIGAVGGADGLATPADAA